MSGSDVLKFRFIGKTEIEYAGEDITERVSGKSRALLAMLLTLGERGASRSRLMGYLWPESSESAARYNLRYNLWQLKKNFDGEEEEPFIIVTRDKCRINEKRPYFCDFKAVLEGDIEELKDAESLEELAELFRGDFFEDCYYAGCEELNEMIIMQRYNLENRKLLIFRKLAVMYFREGRKELCLDRIRICEELDPYDEQTAEMKIRILVNSGRYSEAIKYYNTFYGRLAVDVGVQPSQEIKDLIAGIKEAASVDSAGIRVEADGLKNVDFYFLSQILKQLVNLPDFRITDYLDEESIKALSAVQSALGKPERQAHPARIAEGFVTLLCGVCSGDRKLTVCLKAGDGADRISSEILSLVREKCDGRLIIDMR